MLGAQPARGGGCARPRPVEPLRRATCRGRDPPGGGRCHLPRRARRRPRPSALAEPRPIRSGGSSPWRAPGRTADRTSRSAGCLRRSVSRLVSLPIR